jgi:ATP synthase protein I
MTPQDRSRRGAAGGSDAERLSKRLHDLSERIQAETAEHAPPKGPGGSGDQGSRYGVAFRLASEFVAAVLVGAGLGWLLDRLAGTSPFGLIILLLFGFGAGILNMARASRRMANSEAAAAAKASPPIDDDDDED